MGWIAVCTMSQTAPAAEMDADEVDQYIDYLHDRIQFLQTELEAAEETVLELEQEGTNSLEGFVNGGPTGGEPGEDIARDLRNVGRFVNHLYGEADVDIERAEALNEAMLEAVDLGSREDHLALGRVAWSLLVQAEAELRED
jgi:hypothetical protein